MEDKIEAKSVGFEWKELLKTDVAIHFRVICKITLVNGTEVTGSSLCVLNKGEQAIGPLFAVNKVSQAENDSYSQANNILYNVTGHRLYPPLPNIFAGIVAPSLQHDPNQYQGT